MCTILKNASLVEMSRQDVFMRIFFPSFFFSPPPCSCCLASQKAPGVALLEDDNLVCGQGNGAALAPASLGDALPARRHPALSAIPQALISRALMDTWELSPHPWLTWRSEVPRRDAGSVRSWWTGVSKSGPTAWQKGEIKPWDSERPRCCGEQQTAP